MTDPVEVRFAFADNLPELLGRSGGSLLISTYRTGHLVVVSAPRGRLAVSFHSMERPMGLAVRPGTLAVCTRSRVWFLHNAPDVAARLDADACFLARSSHFTGDVQAHELAWVSRPDGAAEPWLVNTLFSCLCAPHPVYSFAPRWRPPFVSSLAPEDRCHLNGLAVADGRPRDVTALAETDTAQGWRPAKVGGGCVIDVESGRTVTRGLTMPHSPRLANGRLLVLHSGVGQLVAIDPADGRWETVAELPGYPRGLAVHGSLAFVGLSKVRATAALAGVPIAGRADQLRCGFAVVDLGTGAIVSSFTFGTAIDELFDVQFLPGIVAPFVSGPFADRDRPQTLWTVPPG